MKSTAIIFAISMLIATLSFGGCRSERPREKTPSVANPKAKPDKPAARRISSFLGVDLTVPYDPGCKPEAFGMNELPFDASICMMDENEAHTVYAAFVTDKRFPQFIGRPVRIFAIINRSIFADPAALAGYLDAFNGKYGPLEKMGASGGLTNENIVICDAKGCSEGFVDYSPRQPHMAFDPSTGYGKQYFQAVSLVNFEIFTEMKNRLDRENGQAAGKAVK